MKSNNQLLAISIMWLVIAAALSIVIWEDVSLAAKLGFLVLGFASGISAGQWLARRSKQ